MTEGVFISGLVIMCRWQLVSWLASHMLISTWITISCVCLLFCFLSPTPTPHPLPFHYTFLPTLIPAANPTHPVTLCEPVLPCTLRPAHLLRLWPCSSERPVHVQPLQRPPPSPPPVHLSRELHTSIFPLYSKIELNPNLCASVDVCERVCVCVQACMHGHVWLWR